MNLKKSLKTLLKEANIYQTQGLLADARTRYEKAIGLINDSRDLKNKDELLAGVERKMASLEKVVYRVEKRTVTPEISATDKDLIKKLFAVSNTSDPDEAAVEGAMALAKFGLFDRAIQEFELLLEKPEQRVEVAKHILRCHMAIRNAHDPMAQFQKWVGNELFPRDELGKLEVFLEKTYGMSSGVPAASPGPMAPPVSQAAPDSAVPKVSAPEPAPAPQPAATQAQAPAPPDDVPDYDPYEDSYDDVLEQLPRSAPVNGDAGAEMGGNDYSEIIDSLVPEKKPEAPPPTEEFIEDYIDYISAIGIPVSVGPREGQVIDVPVNLQTSDTVNLIVASMHKDLIAMLRQGAVIEKLSLKSPISTNSGTGTVVAAALIDQGPRQGDYSVDLKIDS